MTALAEASPTLRARSASRFREDINALRAVAVLSVLGFHFDLGLLEGGFVGVDVFFVISGFLMTRIVVDGLDAGRFSLSAFYAARVRRIVPALLAMLAAVLAFGAVAVDPLTLAAMASNAATSALFLSNIQYGLQNGYFSDASDANWLLHTWSLSVEWQFYMVYPLALMLAARSDRLWRRHGAAVLVATVVLYAATVVYCALSWRSLQIGFFMLPTRAFEMLAGGAVALAAGSAFSADRQRAVATAGLALIGGSVLLIPAEGAWPSALTAVPVVGTALVILAGERSPGWARLPGIQTVGLWSYSIYLWHWPIVAGLRYFGWEDSDLATAVGSAGSIGLGGLSYRFVEQRFHGRTEPAGLRDRGRTIAGGLAAVLAAAALLVGSSGLEAVKLGRLSPDTVAALDDYGSARADWRGGDACPGGVVTFGAGRRCDVGPSGPGGVLVIGDSHAEQLIPRLAARADRLRAGVRVLYSVGCPPLPGVSRSLAGYDCPAFTDAALAEAGRGGWSKVVIVAAWGLYLPEAAGASAICEPARLGCRVPADEAGRRALAFAGADRLGEAIRRLGQAGVPVVLAAPYPTSADYAGRRDGAPSADRLYRDSFLADRPVRLPPITRADYDARTAFARAVLARAADGGATVIDPAVYWCADVCEADGAFGFPFKDGHHVREAIAVSDGFSVYDAALGLSPDQRDQRPARSSSASLAATQSPAVPSAWCSFFQKGARVFR